MYVKNPLHLKTKINVDRNPIITEDKSLIFNKYLFYI